MAKGIVAVVGRPNVGKSTFFNKLTGERISIVDDTPGVTRDRISADVEWNGRVLTLVDTGGIEPETNSALLRQMRAQAEMAIAAADVILFLTDLRTGVTDADREIATMLRKSKKPVLPVVNKVDAPGDLPADFYEFYSLGLGDPLPVSSIHGTGCGDVLDAVLELLPEPEDTPPEEGVIRVAVDIQKTGSEIPAPGIQDLNSRRVHELPHRGNVSAGKSHVSLPDGSAGAVQNPGVLNEIIEHDRASFCFLPSVAPCRRLCKAGDCYRFVRKRQNSLCYTEKKTIAGEGAS